MRTTVFAIAALGISAFFAPGCATSASQAPDDDSLAKDEPDGSGGAGGAGGADGTGGSHTTSGSGGSGGSGSGSGNGNGGNGFASSSTSSSSSGATKPKDCGNGKLDDGESCDGQLFGGKTCSDFGMSGGQLQCNEYCAVVVNQCTPSETCNNQTDDDNDGKTDCDDSDCLNQKVCTDSCGVAVPLTLPAYEFGSTLGRPSLVAPVCASSSGSELVYSLAATKDTKYKIELSSFLEPMVLAVRTVCADKQAETACSALAAYTQELTIDAKKGNTYFIIVDAVSGKPDDFSLIAAETQ